MFSSDLGSLIGSGHQAGHIAISLVLAGLVLVRRKHPTAAFAIAVAIAAVHAGAGHAPGRFPSAVGA